MKKYMLLCVVSAFLGAVMAIWLLRPDPSETPLDANERPLLLAQNRSTERPRVGGESRRPINLERLTPDERTNVVVYEQVNRGVVNINTKSLRGNNFFFFETPSEGAGSGVVLDRRGHILTNYHVVEGAREIQVTLSDGTTYDAQLIGEDPNNDIAVVKIDAPAETLHPVPFGDSSNLLVGQKVYAIGNPFGLERTLTTGVISMVNRSMRSRNRRLIKSIIQIDAAINPGNSGGPLIDTQGKMIGVNTAIASRTGQSAGVGFAIPVNTIARVVPQLIEHGRVIRADLGIGRVFETDRGFLIATLEPGGAAEQAGLQGFRVVRERRRRGNIVYEIERVDRSQADIIVAVDGKRLDSYDQLLEIIESHKPGDQVKVSVIRDDEEIEVPVQLRESTE